jgi:Holliday junction DNA helicase RuvB
MTDIQKDSIINPSQKPDDYGIDLNLRPKTLGDYIGQQQIKDNLNIFMQAAKERDEAIEHVLLYGMPGLGKTSLAHIIAREMGVNIRVTSGPAIEKTGDLAAILTNLEPKDILFIDEIHRLNKTVEEILYPAMEDYALDIIIGKGPSARTVRLDLPKFTLIGATTRISLMSSPLRDRFGTIYKLQFYEPNELQDIILRSSNILSTNIEKNSALEIANRCRKTPRIANRLLKRVRDYAQVHKADIINNEMTNKALDLMLIDKIGLDEIDRKFLLAIIEKFNGGPVGLNTVSATIAEDISTIEEIIEPYLLQLGFINKTPRGRIATSKAYNHLGKSIPDNIL